MDILYQLFYTVFSMSCMALVLLPVCISWTFRQNHYGFMGNLVFAGGLSVGNEQPGLPV